MRTVQFLVDISCPVRTCTKVWSITVTSYWKIIFHNKRILRLCCIENKELFICPFKTIDEIKIPEEFCSRDLDLDSDLRYLLPRRQGPGLCATGLVSYLVTLHNELVYAVDRHTREDSRYVFKAGYVAFLIKLYWVSSYLNFKQRDRWVRWVSFRGVCIKNPSFHLGAWHRNKEPHSQLLSQCYWYMIYCKYNTFQFYSRQTFFFIKTVSCISEQYLIKITTLWCLQWLQSESDGANGAACDQLWCGEGSASSGFV